MWKDLKDKQKIHVVLTPFDYRNAVIFQALIPTLNAFQTSGGIICEYGLGNLCCKQCNFTYVFNELMLAFLMQHMLIKNFAFICRF
jgi:hypothetical protein